MIYKNSRRLLAENKAIECEDLHELEAIFEFISAMHICRRKLNKGSCLVVYNSDCWEIKLTHLTSLFALCLVFLFLLRILRDECIWVEGDYATKRQTVDRLLVCLHTYSFKRMYICMYNSVVQKTQSRKFWCGHPLKLFYIERSLFFLGFLGNVLKTVNIKKLLN